MVWGGLEWGSVGGGRGAHLAPVDETRLLAPCHGDLCPKQTLLAEMATWQPLQTGKRAGAKAETDAAFSSLLHRFDFDIQPCPTSDGLLGFDGLPNSLLSVLYACQQSLCNSQILDKCFTSGPHVPEASNLALLGINRYLRSPGRAQ